MSAALSALQQRSQSGDASSVLVGSDHVLRAADVLSSVDRIAASFEREGIRSIAIAADNSPDWIVVDLAARQAGIALVPLPPFFSAAQVAHVLSDSGVDAIAADEFGSVPLASLPTRFVADLTPQIALLRVVGPRRATPLMPGTAKISYTSGTTGSPKGVCLTQAAMDRVAQSLREATAELAIDRHLCLLPLATLLENIAGVDAPLLAGAEIALPPLSATGILGASGLDVARLIECLNTFQPASIILLPQLLAGLVGAVEQGAKLPESLRFAAVGGAVVGLPLLDRADRAGIPVFEGYGLTECCSVVALNTPAARRAGSVGRPLPHCRIRIGTDSEVHVKGAGMSGYLGDALLSGEEIATGDIGHLDADGFLYISGRKKNLIITSYGRNLSPEWVEASLTATAPIAQAAVFGDGSPFIVAVIVPARSASGAAIENAIEQVNLGLPDYARVRHWIAATEPFTPGNGMWTANGRVRRGAIQKRYAHDIDACYAPADQERANTPYESIPRSEHGFLQ